jgi:hypothetical protein
MVRWALLIVVIACACSTKTSSLPADIRVAEKDVKHALDGVIISATGVYIEHQRPDDVPAALARSTKNPIDVWLLADREPASRTILALRAIARAKKRDVRLKRVADMKEMEICPAGVRLHDEKRPPTANEDETVDLSLFLTIDHIWVGLSRVNEFQEIPRETDRYNYSRLEDALKGHKTSAFFAERTDIEIATEPGVTGDILADAIFLACKAGFRDIAVLPPERLSARPTL